MSAHPSFPIMALRHLLHGAAALAVIGSATPAAHAADDDVMTLTVSASGLDLASASGQAAMRRRVELAARRVCDDGEHRSLQEADAYSACHDAAVAGAMPQVQTLIAQAGHAGLLVADLSGGKP